VPALIIRCVTLVVVCCAMPAMAAAADSTQALRSTSGMTKSPTTAILYSMAFPGLGQYYTESYWKIPIFTGGTVAGIVLLLDNHTSYRDADAAYFAAVNAGESAAVTARLLRQRESYRDNRDVAGLAIIATYAVAAIDAYVGAHLFDFDVSDDLSMQLLPTVGQPVRLSITARF